MVIKGSGPAEEKKITVTTVLEKIDLARREAIFDIITSLYRTRTVTKYHTVTSVWRNISVWITALYTIYTLTSPIQTSIVESTKTKFLKTVIKELETVISGSEAGGGPAGGTQRHGPKMMSAGVSLPI